MSDIIGFEACAKELRRLLDEISGNIKIAGENGPDALHQAVLTETRKLVDFTNRTEPKDILDKEEVENIRKIDEAADAARQTILGDSANVIIGHMQEQTSQLNQLEKSVRQQTAEHKHKASLIHLVPVCNAIDALTKTVEAVKDAMEALSEADSGNAVVKGSIDSLLQSITALQEAAQDLEKSN